jgi:hypothetical protein
MRKTKKRMRRELAALGHPPYEPTEAMRNRVRVLAFNKTPVEIIAKIVDLDRLILVYYYHRELELTDHQIAAEAASNIMELASQRVDLGVALRANEALMQRASPSWVTPPKPHGDLLAVGSMSLEDTDREIARLKLARAEPQGHA